MQEDQRCSDYTNLLKQELTVREKMLVLLHRVRESGLCNMYTETGEAMLHAHCFGVYCGLLQHPRDYRDGTLASDLPLIYWQYLKQNREDAERHEKLASMLPFGHEYYRMFANYEGGDSVPTLLDTKQSVKLAVFVMRWVGKERFVRLLRALRPNGREQSEQIRDVAIARIPLITHTGSMANDQLNLAYGIEGFTDFIRDAKNRAQLTEAVERELEIVIDLRHIELIEKFH